MKFYVAISHKWNRERQEIHRNTQAKLQAKTLVPPEDFLLFLSAFVPGKVVMEVSRC